MIDWLKGWTKKNLEKIHSTGGYPEKKAAIEAKTKVAEAILNSHPIERRWHDVPMVGPDRRVQPA